jgi:hypothetical protein
VRITGFQVTMAILAVVWLALVIWGRRGDRRQRAALARLITQDRYPLDARDLRDPVRCAWGPGQRISVTFHECGCSVVEDAAGEHLFPCTRHERENDDLELWKAELGDM